MVWRCRPLIPCLLSETRHQRSHASRRPPLYRQGACRRYINSFAGAQGYAIAASSPTNGDPPIDHKNRSLAFGGINRPLRAAHRRYRLRRNNLEFISALWDLEQQSPAAELDRIHTAVSITQGISGTIFDDDGDPRFAMNRLRGDSRTLRRASHGGLRRSRCDWGKRTCECNAYRADNRFHDHTSPRLIEPQNVASKVRR